MNDEIKEILSLLNSSSWSNEAKQIEDYITNLQQENERLKKDYAKIVNDNCDYLKLEQENETRQQDINNLTYQLAKMKEENERLKEELVKIPKAKMEYDLELEDYKSRCEKADNQLKIIMQIIKEQPTRNVEDDEWIENRLIGVVNILKNGSEKDG